MLRGEDVEGEDAEREDAKGGGRGSWSVQIALHRGCLGGERRESDEINTVSDGGMCVAIMSFVDPSPGEERDEQVDGRWTDLGAGEFGGWSGWEWVCDFP